MSNAVVYIGKDLEAMSFAVNYHRWILNAFKPYLGKRLVEVGAGTGLFSKLLLELTPESISLVEPSVQMHRILEAGFRESSEGGGVEIYNAGFVDVADRIKEAQQPDSIIYVNVLEHISDDEAELRTVWHTLDPGGKVFIFVPALQWLYGNFDRGVGHFRRYTKQELEGKCGRAGFHILKSIYFDLVGILPWWIQYRLFRASSLNPNAVGLYDKMMVPVTKAIESLIEPPLGKNLLLIAEKA